MLEKCVFAALIRGRGISTAGRKDRRQHNNHIMALCACFPAPLEGQSVLIPKLLRQDALLEPMFAIEHHEELDGARLLDIDLDDIARLEVIGDGADRPFRILENGDRDVYLVGDEGAPPTPRPKRADGRHGEKR